MWEITNYANNFARGVENTAWFKYDQFPTPTYKYDFINQQQSAPGLSCQCEASKLTTQFLKGAPPSHPPTPQ